MITSAIKDLERAMRILNDIPKNIEKEKTRMVSAMNEIFETAHEEFAEDEISRKSFIALKKSIMEQMDKFCSDVCANVEEEVRIVEE